MRKFCFFFLVLVFAHQALLAQNFSNKGKDFWLGYGYHLKKAQNFKTFKL